MIDNIKYFLAIYLLSLQIADLCRASVSIDDPLHPQKAQGSSVSDDCMPDNNRSLFKRSQIRAESGDKDGMYNLAYCYETPAECSPINIKLAFYWYKRSAELGNPSAMSKVAFFYKNGLVDSNLKINAEASFYWYKKAAEHGVAKAMVYIADYYSEADGCENSLENKRLAVIWYERAALAGNVHAMVSLAGIFSRAEGFRGSLENNKKAFFWARKAAELGDHNGMFFLASCLYCTIGCEGSDENKRLAGAWFEKSALAGNVHAMSALASLLLGPQGYEATSENKKLAVFWYEKAAMAGDLPSIEFLAGCLYNAIGCESSPENSRKSFFWYEKAALAGRILSMRALGVCLSKAIGCEDSPENKKLAVTWYEKAAVAGDAESMLSLAVCLYRARGCEDSTENRDKAIYWLRKAAELGHIKAMQQIATVFLEDPSYKDVPANNKEAVKWLTKGMELGSKQSTLDLGNVYFYGAKGVEKNNQLALVCFEKVKRNWTVSNLIGAIYLGQRNYAKAFESYLEAKCQGAIVSIGLIDFLQRKCQLLIKKTSDSAKAKNKAVRNAVTYKQKEIEQDVKVAKELYAKLLMQLEGNKEPLIETSDESISATTLLNMIRNGYQAFEQGLKESSDLFEKRACVDSFTLVLSELEERLLIAEQEVSNKKYMETIRRKVQVGLESYSPMEIGQDESPNKEVKARAEKTLADDKNRRHAKHMKKHNKSKKTSKAKKEIFAPETISPSLIKGPFADMKKPEKPKKAELTDAAWNNVYKIRDVIRDAIGLDDAIGKLKKLPGDFDFQDITPEYACIPNADLAFEMRVNQKYRAVIAFIKVTEIVYEQGDNGNNSNHPIKKEIYKLYGDTIYIKDLHIKK
jgi:TPR repeat protein